MAWDTRVSQTGGNCELCVHKGKYLDSHVKARKPHICICEMLNVIAFLGKRHSGMRELCCFVVLERKRLSKLSCCG